MERDIVQERTFVKDYINCPLDPSQKWYRFYTKIMSLLLGTLLILDGGINGRCMLILMMLVFVLLEMNVQE